MATTDEEAYRLLSLRDTLKQAETQRAALFSTGCPVLSTTVNALDAQIQSLKAKIANLLEQTRDPYEPRPGVWTPLPILVPTDITHKGLRVFLEATGNVETDHKNVHCFEQAWMYGVGVDRRRGERRKG